jgi:hypothetical protein
MHNSIRGSLHHNQDMHNSIRGSLHHNRDRHTNIRGSLHHNKDRHVISTDDYIIIRISIIVSVDQYIIPKTDIIISMEHYATWQTEKHELRWKEHYLSSMKWNFDRKEQRQWNMKSYLGYTWRYLPKLITVLTNRKIMVKHA